MVPVASRLDSFLFFFNDTATTEIYTLSLHDALPICARRAVPAAGAHPRRRGGGGLDAAHARHALGGVAAGLRAGGLGEGARRARDRPEARAQIGRAHRLNPVTATTRMPSSSLKKKNKSVIV